MSIWWQALAAAALAALILPARGEALQEAVAAVQRKDYPAAVRLLEPLARAGVAQAQMQLGLLHYHGHGVRESDARAMQWFERAARQGLAEAQYQLGNMYAFGLAEVAADTDAYRVAAQWYFEAARQGHAQSQYSLGLLFLTGSGVTPDAGEAARWMERAAAQGHVQARAYQSGARRPLSPRAPD
jgi:TPR repeat protein